MILFSEEISFIFVFCSARRWAAETNIPGAGRASMLCSRSLHQGGFLPTPTGVLQSTRGNRKEKSVWRLILHFWLHSLFLRNKLHGFLLDVALQGGSRWSAASQEITPQWDDVGSCPFLPLSARICWAKMSLSESPPAALTLLLYSWHCTPHLIHVTEAERMKNRIQHRRSIKYHINVSWRNGYLRLRVTQHDSNVVQRRKEFCSESFVLCFHVFDYLEVKLMELKLACVCIVCFVCTGLMTHFTHWLQFSWSTE